MRFVPADFISSSTDACAPLPSATIVITAATPMIMPSIVRQVRSLLTRSALRAIRKLSSRIMKVLVRSFESQRLDRIEASGLPRRIEPEEHAQRGCDAHSDHDAERRDGGRPPQRTADAARCADPQEHADKAARKAQRRGFGQKLRHDVAAAR